MLDGDTYMEQKSEAYYEEYCFFEGGQRIRINDALKENPELVLESKLSG